MLASQSATQTADFMRRTAELVAVFVSWLVYRRLQRDPAIGAAERLRLERTANLFVIGAVIGSGLLLLLLALSRLSAHQPGGNVIPGLIIAVLGFITNGWFWFRYRATNRAEPDAVIAAQEALYRTKTSVDLCVTVALGAVALAPAHPLTRYVDTIGSITVAIYLLWSGARLIQKMRISMPAALGPTTPAAVAATEEPGKA